MTASQRIAALAGIAILVLTASAVLASEGVVNINTASESQLMLLPRVGPSLAKKIVEYRQANGEFKAPDELVLVPGDRRPHLRADGALHHGQGRHHAQGQGKGQRRTEGGASRSPEKTEKEGA